MPVSPSVKLLKRSSKAFRLWYDTSKTSSYLQTLNCSNQPTPQSRSELAPIVDSLSPPQDDRTEPFKVSIVGAGVAGLFTAMIFDYLNERFKTNVEYQIIECNNDKRLGGRLYTHYFSPETDDSHDYYDVGAMRFPDITTMNQ